eukprot:423221-Alexandrium_andersonii.AAC.1
MALMPIHCARTDFWMCPTRLDVVLQNCTFHKLEWLRATGLSNASTKIGPGATAQPEESGSTSWQIAE